LKYEKSFKIKALLIAGLFFYHQINTKKWDQVNFLVGRTISILKIEAIASAPIIGAMAIEESFPLRGTAPSSQKVEMKRWIVLG
jgi:hypothetical protein